MIISGDVTPQEMSLLVSNEEYLQKYLSVPEVSVYFVFQNIGLSNG